MKSKFLHSDITLVVEVEVVNSIHNILAKNQKAVVFVVSSLHVYIIICYKLKI